MLHYQTVSPDLTAVLKKLMQLDELSAFRLVGGTSLSLQMGHRKSVDIDFFTDKAFNLQALQGSLQGYFETLTITWKNQNGFTSLIDGVKTDFFNWNTPFILPVYKEDNIRLMQAEEIGAMKFEAITNRKEKKDFYDIAFLFKEYSLKHLLNIFIQKYPFFDKFMVIESLTSVDRADDSLNPVILKDMHWTEAKAIIINTVEQYYQEQVTNRKKAQEERISKAEQLLKNKRSKE